MAEIEWNLPNVLRWGALREDQEALDLIQSIKQPILKNLRH